MKEMIYPDFVPENNFDIPGLSGIIRLTPELKDGASPVKILDSGIYKNRQYYIVRYFLGYPLAYVEFNEPVPDHFLYQIDVHGDITFRDKIRWLSDDSTYIGWDYIHDGDCIPHLLKFDGKKWTTEEILEHVHSVIDQLESLTKGEN